MNKLVLALFGAVSLAASNSQAVAHDGCYDENRGGGYYDNQRGYGRYDDRQDDGDRRWEREHRERQHDDRNHDDHNRSHHGVRGFLESFLR